MLSRVAERIYWAARYLERIENTARLISVYDKLMFDLPRNFNIGWYNLITLNSAEEAFAKRFKVQDERNVVKFLLGDDSNPSSVASCLALARENLRTTRDVVPAESWELINELYYFVTENLQQGINRGKRFDFLDGIIKGCQQIQGLIQGSMPHDEAWYFLKLGRTIERADMTTRIVDAGVRAQIQAQEEDDAVNTRQIVWGHVLRSVDGEQSYRRGTRARVDGALVAEYILQDTKFPRALAHCLQQLVSAVEALPANESVLSDLNKLIRKVFRQVDYSDLGEPMKEYLNELQLYLAGIHISISENWFINQ